MSTTTNQTLTVPVTYLSASERKQIAEILSRRANEIAGFHDIYRQRPDHFGSVQLALDREMTRLRRLADKVALPDVQESDD